MSGAELYWLPEATDWRPRLRALATATDAVWESSVALAGLRLDFVQTSGLDSVVQKRLGVPPSLATRPVRLALAGSCTTAHLHPAIRVAGLRRGLWVAVHEGDYGQYWPDLLDPPGALRAFDPTHLLLALDAHHLTAGLHAGMARPEADAACADALARIRQCWARARQALGCDVLHQLPLPIQARLMGGNEGRLPGSRAAFIARLTDAIRAAAEADGVTLIDPAAHALHAGLAAWHDPALWHRAKQEIAPAAAPFYGDLVGRVMAAAQGRSAKCLVLDLDNTIWGGVIGDDGLDGIVLGQGSAQGEAHAAVQDYARELSRRGIILAVCSKNDEANAIEAFDRHPEMVLRRNDIASFVANWDDKPANIRAIAAELNIGLDSLVFLDDNPFERALVRQELPMVFVPEIPEDPSFYPQALADSGCFEGIRVTEEDRTRGTQYQENRQRDALMAGATDMESYLRGLGMTLLWRPFDSVGLPRIVQLINKTNQFNLTTRRITEDEARAVIDDPDAFGLQLRLLDRFGDNGIIAIVIGRRRGTGLEIDTWLMSCRVLGRQVEPATLGLVAAQARRLGATSLVGSYLPTAKNGMVRDHYDRLGFTMAPDAPDGTRTGTLDLDDYAGPETFIDVKEG